MKILSLNRASWYFIRIASVKFIIRSVASNCATVTSSQKLRHMVTLPHFEKVRGDVGIVGKCVGVWGEEGGMWEEV